MTQTIHCISDQLVPIEKLKPHPKNRNRHSQEQIERLAKIISYSGFRKPIVVSNRSGFITSGHGRLLAAQLLGMKELPVSFQDYESDEQELADLTADNAIASWAQLDLSGINADLADLGPDFDVDLLGIRGFLLDLSEVDPESKVGSTEFGSEEFETFRHRCPRCNFEFDSYKKEEGDDPRAPA